MAFTKMAPVLAPLPIFGIALTATAIVTLVILHVWHTSLDNHRNTCIELPSTDSSPFDEECGLGARDKFRGATVSAAPGQPGRGRMWTAAKVQHGDFRDAEMGINLGGLRSVGEERGGRYGYHMSGARDDDAGDNPFATPPGVAAIMRGDAPRQPTGVDALRHSSGSSVYSTTGYDGAGGDSSAHHGCDLTDGPLRHPYTNYRHDNMRAHASSPLRHAVTISTITTEFNASSIRESTSNNTLKPSSRGRSISNLSTSSSTRSKSANRMSGSKSVSPLEVHPWRLSYS